MAILWLIEAVKCHLLKKRMCKKWRVCVSITQCQESPGAYNTQRSTAQISLFISLIAGRKDPDHLKGIIGKRNRQDPRVGRTIDGTPKARHPLPDTFRVLSRFEIALPSDRKSTRLNSSHKDTSRMPSSA